MDILPETDLHWGRPWWPHRTGFEYPGGNWTSPLSVPNPLHLYPNPLYNWFQFNRKKKMGYAKKRVGKRETRAQARRNERECACEIWRLAHTQIREDRRAKLVATDEYGNEGDGKTKRKKKSKYGSEEVKNG